MMANQGDLLPVSAFPVDGTWPTDTAQWEKRNIALEIPVWDPKICIQCNKCAMVCPHAAIRAKVYEPAALAGAPETFKSIDYKGGEFKGMKYTLQVAPEDCTGCSLCVMVCPAKDKANPKHKSIDMAPQRPLREAEASNYDFFLDLPEVDRTQREARTSRARSSSSRCSSISGACAGCGETPYVKLLTQLFGDRLLVANATGCSSIYGGNLPTTPYTPEPRRPRPGLVQLAVRGQRRVRLRLPAGDRQARSRRTSCCGSSPAQIGEPLVDALLDGRSVDRGGHRRAARPRRRAAPACSRRSSRPKPAGSSGSPTTWCSKSVWIVGGDGWAYDIGYGGLDHVLAQSRNVNLLVLDTEVYSNTGGQASKATPIGASAKFAAAGKAGRRRTSA